MGKSVLTTQVRRVLRLFVVAVVAAALATGCSAEGPVAEVPAPPPGSDDDGPTGPDTWAMISGLVDGAAGTLELNPVFVLPVARPPAATPGAVEVQLLDEDGEVLSEGSTELTSFTEGSMARFSLFVPAAPRPVHRLVVAIEGSTVAELEGSGTVPEIAIVEPARDTTYAAGDVAVEWSDAGSDSGGARTYGVFVSADGTSWRSVVGETTERTAVVPAGLLEHGAAGRVRIMVTVSDGINASFEVVQPFASAREVPGAASTVGDR